MGLETGGTNGAQCPTAAHQVRLGAGPRGPQGSRGERGIPGAYAANWGDRCDWCYWRNRCTGYPTVLQALRLHCWPHERQVPLALRARPVLHLRAGTRTGAAGPTGRLALHLRLLALQVATGATGAAGSVVERYQFVD